MYEPKLHTGDRLLFDTCLTIGNFKAGRCYRIESIHRATAGDRLVYDFEGDHRGWFCDGMDARLVSGQIRVVSYGEDRKFI